MAHPFSNPIQGKHLVRAPCMCCPCSMQAENSGHYVQFFVFVFFLSSLSGLTFLPILEFQPKLNTKIKTYAIFERAKGGLSKVFLEFWKWIFFWGLEGDIWRWFHRHMHRIYNFTIPLKLNTYWGNNALKMLLISNIY